MIIRRYVGFLLNNRAGREKAPLRMRVRLQGKAVDIPLGVSVSPKAWDKKRQRMLPKTMDADRINMEIAEWQRITDEIFARFEIIEKRMPSIVEFRDLFNDYAGRGSRILERLPSPDKKLTDALSAFMADQGEANAWTPATFEKFHAMQNRLKAFDADLTFNALDETVMHRMVAFMSRQGLRNTTIAKDLALFRWFLRWCASRGFYDGSLHNTFKPKLRGTDGNAKEIIYLTREELRRLEDTDFKWQHLNRARDVFLFCCFTGLRYSDAAKLKKSDVKPGYIDVVTQKTVDGLRIELNSHSRRILEKYKDAELPGGNALPVVSNQKMNDYLKEIGKAINLDEQIRIVYFTGSQRHEALRPKWQLLTTHCGRRTFVITALQLGIPAEVIMKWTGHSSFASMKPYVKIVDDLKERSMKLFDLV